MRPLAKQGNPPDPVQRTLNGAEVPGEIADLMFQAQQFDRRLRAITYTTTFVPADNLRIIGVLQCRIFSACNLHLGSRTLKPLDSLKCGITISSRRGNLYV
jgi:hypothetical protein